MHKASQRQPPVRSQRHPLANLLGKAGVSDSLWGTHLQGCAEGGPSRARQREATGRPGCSWTALASGQAAHQLEFRTAPSSVPAVLPCADAGSPPYPSAQQLLMRDDVGRRLHASARQPALPCWHHHRQGTYRARTLCTQVQADSGPARLGDRPGADHHVVKVKAGRGRLQVGRWAGVAGGAREWERERHCQAWLLLAVF